MKTLLLFNSKKKEGRNSIVEDLSFQVLNPSSMQKIRGGDDPPNNDEPPANDGNDYMYPPDY